MQLRSILPVLLLAASAALAPAQFAAPAPEATSEIKDTTALKPPAGARVAIVEFSDMQCPHCAKVNPTLIEVTARYHIPWVRHDFIIPYHSWSRNAALYARWFDVQEPGMGNQYRDQVFANQFMLLTLPMLRSFTDKFAADHGTALPADFDPKGELAAALDADNQLGHRTGIDQTPTIFVVTSGSKGLPYIRVGDVETLAQVVEQALADTAK